MDNFLDTLAYLIISSIVGTLFCIATFLFYQLIGMYIFIIFGFTLLSIWACKRLSK